MIEAWLEKAKDIWPEELPGILWAYRSTVRTPTRQTPFRLAFEHEVVISAKVGLTIYRVSHHDEGRNEEGKPLQLDLRDEIRATTE